MDTSVTQPRRWAHVLRVIFTLVLAVLVLGGATIAYRSAMFYYGIEQCFDPEVRRHTINYNVPQVPENGVTVRMPGVFRGRGPFLQWIGAAFSTVSMVSLQQPGADQLNAVARLNGVETLRIHGRAGEDPVDWSALGRISFQNVDLQRSGIRDEELAELLHAKSVVNLAISDEPALTPAGLMILKEHTAFESLSVSHFSSETSAGWKDVLGQLTSLQSFMAFGRAMDDGVMESIALLPELRKLYLGETALTDRGLAALAAAPKLEHIIIRKASITKDGVAQLTSLKSLQRLWIARCDFSEENRDALVSLFPACDVRVMDTRRDNEDGGQK